MDRVIPAFQKMLNLTALVFMCTEGNKQNRKIIKNQHSKKSIINARTQKSMSTVEKLNENKKL